MCLKGGLLSLSVLAREARNAGRDGRCKGRLLALYGS